MSFFGDLWDGVKDVGSFGFKSVTNPLGFIGAGVNAVTGKSTIPGLTDLWSMGGGNNPEDPYAGMPASPEWDPSKYDLTSKLKPGFDALDSGAYGKQQQEAMRTGPSAWSALAKKNNDLEATGAYDRNVASTAARTADAMGALGGVRGGVTSGAMANIVNQAGRNQMAGDQDVTRQKNINNSQIDINDETNRIQQLQQATGNSLDRLKMWGQGQQADVQNRLGFDKDLYNTKMQTWAAGKQADATAHSGKK